MSRQFTLLENVFLISLLKQNANFPLYEITRNNITKDFFIRLALAGYTKDEIKIQENNGTLVISSNRNKEIKIFEGENILRKDINPLIEQEEYLSNSKIAKRNFLISFNIPNLKVSKPASFQNGLLVVTLKTIQTEINSVLIE